LKNVKKRHVNLVERTSDGKRGKKEAIKDRKDKRREESLEGANAQDKPSTGSQEKV